MNIRHLLIFFTLYLSLFTLSGCSEKEDTTPSMADTDRLESLIDRSLPRVKSFCDEYGTYLLYQFDQEQDFAYQFEEAANWEQATLERLSREEASDAVDYLYEHFFPAYSDAFKSEFFPRKMLLVKSIKGKSLGISQPDAKGMHQAVVSLNSMTIAYDQTQLEALSEEGRQTYLRQLHTTLLAGYLVNVRSHYPIGDAYLSLSQPYYSSLMEEHRTQARRLPDEFFLNRGFFRPADDESTYFVSAQEDLTEFTRRLILMDEQLQDSLADYPVMESKLGLVANGLKAMGIDIAAINPLAKYYLEIGETTVPPSVVASEVVTPTSEASLTLTFLRGSKGFAKAEIWVNGSLQHLLDLSAESQASRLVRTVTLTGLEEGTNPVEIRLFEEGRPRPSAICNICAYFVSKAIYMHIENSLGEKYRLHVYNYDYTDGSSTATSIRFRKIATEVDMNTGVDNGEQRFWVIFKEDGLVRRIIEKLEVVDFVNLKNSYEPQCTYEFQYDEKGQLEGVTLDGQPYAGSFRYSAGLLTAYTYAHLPSADGSQAVRHDVAYSPTYDTSVTPALRLDCLDAAASGHCFKYKGDERLNYFYLPDLPAIIPGTVAGIPLQILYAKYLFTELTGIWSNSWLLEGNTNMTEVTLDDVTWTYHFVLQ